MKTSAPSGAASTCVWLSHPARWRRICAAAATVLYPSQTVA